MGKGADKGKEEDAAVVAKAKGDEDARWFAMYQGRAVG